MIFILEIQKFHQDMSHCGCPLIPPDQHAVGSLDLKMTFSNSIHFFSVSSLTSNLLFSPTIIPTVCGSKFYKLIFHVFGFFSLKCLIIILFSTDFLGEHLDWVFLFPVPLSKDSHLLFKSLYSFFFFKPVIILILNTFKM